MAERLTDKNHEAINKCGEFSSCYSCRKEVCYITQICEKLGKLEDILEKYGIESLDTLEHIIKKGQVITSTIEGFAKEAYNEMEQDRDTWKRACESMAFNYDKKLTCNTCYIKEQCSKQYGGNYEQALCNYFYQQAKKEGEN